MIQSTAKPIPFSNNSSMEHRTYKYLNTKRIPKRFFFSNLDYDFFSQKILILIH